MFGLLPRLLVQLILLKGSYGCVSNGHYPAMVGCGENKWVPCNNGEKQPTKQPEQTTKRGSQEEEGTANWFPSPRTFSDFPDDQKTPKGPKKDKRDKGPKKDKGSKKDKGPKKDKGGKGDIGDKGDIEAQQEKDKEGFFTCPDQTTKVPLGKVGIVSVHCCTRLSVGMMLR